MRIVESRAIVPTVRPPKPAPETMPAVAPEAPPQIPRPCADPTRHGLPEAGFVMQLIATVAAPSEADPSAPRSAGLAYGNCLRATRTSRSGDLIARSI